jgi:hypothetical protein
VLSTPSQKWCRSIYQHEVCGEQQATGLPLTLDAPALDAHMELGGYHIGLQVQDSAHLGLLTGSDIPIQEQRSTGATFFTEALTCYCTAAAAGCVCQTMMLRASAAGVCICAAVFCWLQCVLLLSVGVVGPAGFLVGKS